MLAWVTRALLTRFLGVPTCITLNVLESQNILLMYFWIFYTAMHTYSEF